uniref:Uncharacterized protein n=1 Tax=Rhizophora mucronata TaxID=61149 RepID=A0A2P2JAA6_RHIMU
MRRTFFTSASPTKPQNPKPQRERERQRFNSWYGKKNGKEIK